MATADEIRRLREETSIFSRLFDLARQQGESLEQEGRRPVLGGLLSKEPVMGTDTIRYEGITPLLLNLIEPIARGIDAPRAAAQNLIPQEDMISEAFGTAGTAMIGGGLAAKPSGSLGANTLRSKVASDVAERGDQVLNMLKSGRADDITDSMLDMRDLAKNTQLNQYLFENYDLPMDKASRMARAREMGFEGNLFHGTGADILNIDREKFGLGENLLGKGFYTTSNPRRADTYVPIGNPRLPRGVFQSGNNEYTEGGNILPIMARSDTEFDARQGTGKINALNIGKAFQSSDFDVEIRDGGDQVFIKSKTNPDLSVYIDSYQDGMITLQKLKDVFGRENVTEILEQAGFSGLKAPESLGSVTKVNYNPQDIRLRFARFDPRLSHLSNLTAANASPIGGILAQSGVSENQAQRIEDYLLKRGLLD